MKRAKIILLCLFLACTAFSGCQKKSESQDVEADIQELKEDSKELKEENERLKKELEEIKKQKEIGRASCRERV